MRRQIVGWLVCVALCMGGSAGAQTPPITVTDPTVAPPVIPFPEWRATGTSDVATEFEVTLPSPVAAAAPNNVIPLRIFLPSQGEAPFRTVVITHYWGATDLRAEVALANDLARRGIASVLFTLPYHLDRTPPGSRSGELAITADTAALRQTMSQAVLDLRRTIDFVESRPEFRKEPIGLAGTSLGAIVAALTYALEPRITHVAFLVGGADIAGILWESSRVVRQREQFRAQGFTEARLRQELAGIEPLSYLPRAAPGKAFLIVARYDNVIPRRASAALAAALPGAQVLQIETGHYGGVLVQRRLQREMANFFATEFAGEEYKAPARLVAPTIRLGITAQSGRGLEVGAGLDVYRFDRAGKVVATIFVSPRTPSFWLTGEISRGFSVGVTVDRKRTNFGVMWSTVL